MLQKDFEIVVLCGAISPEREVSINSGKACAEALRERFPRVRVQVLEENALPANLCPERDIIFPVIHGDYGEDGGIQRDLDARGFVYAGGDADASALCIDKAKTKLVLKNANLPTPRGIAFSLREQLSAEEIVNQVGGKLVLKPADKGSSVGLFLPETLDELREILSAQLNTSENWLAESRIYGKELTVGLLNGNAMGIVEICPRVGVYDYKNKYTKGNTEYLFPAPIPEDLTHKIQMAAEKVFKLCGCRDFARIDLILQENGDFYFLEVNTMPGLTATSLFPKSASCKGMSFCDLTEKMIQPAIERFKALV